MEKDTKIAIASSILGALLIGTLLWFALATTEVKLTVDSVYTQYVVYATADYSETESGFDFDGDYYSDTDYWHEAASEKLFWHTMNGVPSNVKVVDPPLSNNIVRNSAFDGITWHRNLTMTLKAHNKGEIDTYALTRDEYEKVLNRQGDYVTADINGFGMIRRLK